MKLRIVLNVVVAVVALAATGLAVRWMLDHIRQPAEHVPEKVVPKAVAPPLAARANHRVEIVGYGDARPNVALDVAPQVSGVVVEKAANFLSGKYVAQGQRLFHIEETDYRLAMEAAEKRITLLNAQLAQLDQEAKNLEKSRDIEIERRDVAKRTVQRLTQLLERNAASENQVDQARETLLGRRVQLQGILNQLDLVPSQRAALEAQVATAQVEMEQARTNLARCVVKSPVTGRVLACQVEVGERVQVGAVCGRLYGTELMEVPVSVPASDLAWIEDRLLELCKSGHEPAEGEERIEARVQWQQPGNGQAVVWPGCVSRIEAGLEAETRTASLVVCVRNAAQVAAADPEGAGAPAEQGGGVAGERSLPAIDVNMFCKVTILGRQLPRVYLLPRQAILPDESVYVVVDGRLARRPVRVARFTTDEAMILPGGGIADGDRVVIETLSAPVVGMSIEAVDFRQAGLNASSPASQPESPQAAGSTAAETTP